MKTENAQNVGIHAFEVTGLGKAPFRFVGFSENAFNCGDGTTKAGGCCDYCFNGIRYECHILSADGKRFKVGTNCVEKVGDKGIMQAYKRSSEFRKIQRDKRQAKGQEAFAACRAMMEANKGKLAATPHPTGKVDWKTRKPLTALDNVQWMIDHCGTAGITRYRKTLATMIDKINRGESIAIKGYGDEAERRADADMLARTGYGDRVER